MPDVSLPADAAWFLDGEAFGDEQALLASCTSLWVGASETVSNQAFSPKGSLVTIAAMRSALGMIGLLIVLAIGYAVYTSQLRHVTDGKPLKQQVDLVAIQSDLLSLAQGERLYLAANGSYATLEQLRSSGVMNSFPGENRSGYAYSAEVDGAAHFIITASPADASMSGLPVVSIDETLQISQ